MTDTNISFPVFDNEGFSAAIHAKAFSERLGQNELARQLGLAPSTICRIVTHRKDPSMVSLAVLLDYLGKRFEDFVI